MQNNHWLTQRVVSNFIYVGGDNSLGFSDSAFFSSVTTRLERESLIEDVSPQNS